MQGARFALRETISGNASRRSSCRPAISGTPPKEVLAGSPVPGSPPKLLLPPSPIPENPPIEPATNHSYQGTRPKLSRSVPRYPAPTSRTSEHPSSYRETEVRLFGPIFSRRKPNVASGLLIFQQKKPSASLRPANPPSRAPHLSHFPPVFPPSETLLSPSQSIPKPPATPHRPQG